MIWMSGELNDEDEDESWFDDGDGKDGVDDDGDDDDCEGIKFGTSSVGTAGSSDGTCGNGDNVCINTGGGGGDGGVVGW